MTLVIVEATAAAANFAMIVNNPTSAYFPRTKVMTVSALDTMPHHFITVSIFS